MKAVILNQLNKYLGKKSIQHFSERAFRLSLTGMNYGNGADFELSGESKVLHYIRQKLKGIDPLTIFDVGGNIGRYSKSLADFFGDEAIIHAFEPSKRTFKRLLSTTAGYTNIIPNNIGFSDKESKVMLFADCEESGLASLYPRNLEHHGISMDRSEEISLTTIDNYCRQNGITQIHFLKLDIEGHELNALKGAAEMLRNNSIDFIQFEFGGCNIDSRTFFKDFYYLLRDRYRIYRILKDGLSEIPRYSEMLEIFLTVNYLAEKR